MMIRMLRRSTWWMSNIGQRVIPIKISDVIAKKHVMSSGEAENASILVRAEIVDVEASQHQLVHLHRKERNQNA